MKPIPLNGAPIEVDTTGTKYITRSGLPVRVYATDHAGQFTISAAYQNKEGLWRPMLLKADGKEMISGDSLYDLFLAPPELEKGTSWVNVYRKNNGEITYGRTQNSRLKADSAYEFIGLSRIACVRVDWTEGEGL